MSERFSHELPPRPALAQRIWTLAMLPVYVWQGLQVRRSTHRMTPPPHGGHIGAPEAESPLRVLIIGDSSAAGVGAETIDESLAGHLLDLLPGEINRPVRIRIAGKNSATSAQIRDFVVPNMAHEAYDYICLNIGTNDAKNFHSGRRFCREFGTLLYALKARWPAATIIWAGVLDMEKVPALPSPLNRILGIRSRLIDHNGKVLCRERGALAPVSNWRTVRENFASDGFHASSRGYREWAEGLSAYIADLEGRRS